MDKFLEIKEKIKNSVLTHSGIFHADDVFCTALLELVFADMKIDVIRSFHVPEDYKGLVFDIGFGEYDHHQANNECYEDGIPLSSFGKLSRILIPEKWGMEVYNEMLSFIKDIDEHDNNGKVKRFGELNPISVLISDFNPQWNSSMNEDEAFLEAKNFAKIILQNKINTILAKIEALDLLKSFDVIDGCLMMNTYVPWKNYAKEHGVRAAVYPSVRGGYNIMVTDSNQWSLPKLWLMNRPKGMEYIHTGLFICQFDTKENALEAYRCIIN